MQTQTTIKRFVVIHVGAATLAFGVLVSGALGVAGLAATGNLSRLAGYEAQVAVPREVDQARRSEQMARFFDLKMARQEAGELSCVRVRCPRSSARKDAAVLPLQGGEGHRDGHAGDNGSVEQCPLARGALDPVAATGRRHD